MARTTIAGQPLKAAVQVENATRVSAGEDDVLVEQLAREFRAVLRQVKDARATDSPGEGFSADGDVRAELPQVAYYGVVSHRLNGIVRRLLHGTDGVEHYKKATLLLTFGDKFAALHEYQAAERYFYQPIVDGWGERRKNEVFVQAVYGVATCQLHKLRREDPFVRFSGTLERLLAALQTLQQGMQVAVQLEQTYSHQYAWLLLNGTVLVYSVARPLQTLGFEREVIVYFKWCLLCLESTVVLSTTQYILWRLQIYVSVCECLEQMALKSPAKSGSLIQSALQCTGHAVQAVERLRREEELDPPLPDHVGKTLCQVETIVSMLLMRAQALAKGEFLGRKAIEAIQDTRQRLRMISDTLDKSHHLPIDNGGVLELFSFAIEIIQPFLDPLQVLPPPSLEEARKLDSMFPLTLHFALLRNAYQLRQFSEASFLLATARNRSAQTSNEESSELELALFESLLIWDTTDADTSTDESKMSTEKLAVALSLKAFVKSTSDATCLTVRDHVTSVALRLWKEGGEAISFRLKAEPKRQGDDCQLSVPLQTGIVLLEAIYATLCAVNFDDLILLGEICIHLCVLHQLQQNRRQAIRTARVFLSLLDRFRDNVASSLYHFSSLLHHSAIDAFSRATFSSNTTGAPTASDCYESDETTGASSRQSVGVKGTGSQFGSLHQELACLHVDITLLVFQLELEEAAAVDDTHVKDVQIQNNSIARRQTSAVEKTETALRKENKRNCYARVLLNVQSIRRTSQESGLKAAEALTSECFNLLRQVESQERELIKDIPVPLEMETAVPQAPRVLLRSSTSITVAICPFKPSAAAAKRRRIAYYMVFAKPSGAGTDVSLNNLDYPGTGEPIYPPSNRATVSGLEPNDSYVFAVAAYDYQGEVIQAIGETSRPVVALNPLPLAAIYGYLAQACYDLSMMGPAKKAAQHVYDYIVTKDEANRPEWASNVFYRHALNRSVIAQWPVLLLNLAVHSIIILCHEEEGDSERDGQLISTNGSWITSKQTAVLQATKMICVAVEIATACADYEQIRVLCFKGYRILLPLLHLDDTNAVTFPALVTFYQAVWCIPSTLWDSDTQCIAARLSFELMRMAWRHRHLVDAVAQQTAKLKSRYAADPQLTPTNEIQELLDCVALTECYLGKPLGSSTNPIRPVTASGNAPLPTQGSSGKAAVLSPPQKGQSASIAANAVMGSPQSTPRGDEIHLPSLNVLLDQSKLGVRDAFKLLEPLFKSNRDSLETFCKLCQCAVSAGDCTAIDEWIPLLKLTGNIGASLKALLREAGFDSAISDPVSSTASVSAQSPPTTARSTVKSPRSQESKADHGDTLSSASPPGTARDEPELGDDDDYVATWCGEICLIQATVLYRELTQRFTQHQRTDSACGPLFDCAFDILHESITTPRSGMDLPSSSEASVQQLQPGSDLADEIAETTPANEDSHPRSTLHRFIALIAVCCRLFSRVHAWQALQSAVQHVVNAIWLEWLSPKDLGKSLTDLMVCVKATLDMIEIVSAAVKDEQAGRLNTTLSPRDTTSTSLGHAHKVTLSLASTTLVSSALSSVNADQTWISNLVEYALQALFESKDWNTLVQTGKRYHILRGGCSRFSEKMLPVIVYAQEQYLAEQISSLVTAQASLEAFVKAFNDAEGKKKKKKSRLVVEEVLTPEEIEFRARRDEMEHDIRIMTDERNSRQRELENVERMSDGVTRTINKGIQALDECHVLLELYRRHGEKRVRQAQIVSAFMQCVALGRQKRQRRVVGKALQELGDFLWERGDAKGAVKYWNESIDNALNTLRATTCWRDVLQMSDADDASSDPRLEGDGLWICLESCIALAKLIMMKSSTGESCVDVALMAASILTRIVTRCSVQHPSRAFLYDLYSLRSQLWPGRDLLVDTELLGSPPVGMMFIIVIDVLLQYEQYTESLPIIAMFEYLARQCFQDINHTANALRFRIHALTHKGRLQAAFETLAHLLCGTSVEQNNVPMLPNPFLEKLHFRDDRPLKDPTNSAVVSWLASLDIPKLYDDLLKLSYKPDTARGILHALLQPLVFLSETEPTEEEANSTVRQVANKLATAVYQLIAQHEKSCSEPLEGDSEQEAQLVEPWEVLLIQRQRAEVLLQRAGVALSACQWSTVHQLSTEAINLIAVSQQRVSSAMKKMTGGILTISSRLPCTFLQNPSTVAIRARIMIVQCDVARGLYQTAIDHVDVAVQEAQESGEEGHFVRQLELLRIQAFVLLGCAKKAWRRAGALLEEIRVNHEQHSTAYVTLLRITAFLLQRQSMEEVDGMSKLQEAAARLKDAEIVLDGILRRDGWVGPSPDVTVDKRLNIYHPCIRIFVELKVEVVEAIAGLSPGSSAELVLMKDEMLFRIDLALKSLQHTVIALVWWKAKLHLLTGSIMKNGMASLGPSGEIEEYFATCAASLVASIEEAICIDHATHDRDLIRRALLELVDLYCSDLVPGRETQHLQAAYHYLTLATLVHSFQRVVFDSLDLHSGSISNVEKLPSFITDAILLTIDDGAKQIAPAAPPAVPSKGGAHLAASIDLNKRPTVDSSRLINFLIRILRDVRALPPCASHQHSIASILHAFLVQNHSSYGRACCVTAIPPVPPDDPEIKAGLICATWMQDMTPALRGDKSWSRGALTLFFMLGTVKLELASDCASEVEAKRKEVFASTPLLSKRVGIDESSVAAIRYELVRLRVVMEDEGSLTVSRATFPVSFMRILKSIQRLFRGGLCKETSDNAAEQPQASVEDNPNPGWQAKHQDDELIHDAFGAVIPISYTLECVEHLESLFQVDGYVRGAVDNALCYFLRDLLDN